MAASFVHEIAVDLPLALSLPVTLGTIVIHALALVGIVCFIRHQHRLGRTGIRFWTDVLSYRPQRSWQGWPISLKLFLWAMVFVLCDEFSQFAPAIYNSPMLYTTLGYGDVTMSS